jgi:hypothetical protein
VPVPNDVYLEPDAPDPVLSAAVVLTLVRRHVPHATRVTAVDESGGEARTYVVDDTLILKTHARTGSGRGRVLPRKSFS